MTLAATSPPAKSSAAKSQLQPRFTLELEIAVHSCIATALMGPRGVGKTSAVRNLAAQQNKDLVIVPVHADMQIEELRGETVLRDGCSAFQTGAFVRAAKEGFWALLDEANLGRPGMMAWLNSVLDENGVVCIPQTGEQFAVHRDFRAFLCFNVGYQGTRAMNEALLDRCRVIHCGYWPVALEAELLADRVPKLSKTDVLRMLKVANAIRAARQKGTVDFDFSIRTLIQWGQDADVRTQDLLESFISVVLAKVGTPEECAPQHLALTEIAKLVLK